MKPIQTISRMIIVALMIMLYCSCSDKYYCEKGIALQNKYCSKKSDTTTILDSTRYRIVYRDTTIYREKDSVGVQKLSPCDGNGRVKNFVQEKKGKDGTVIIKGDSATNSITGIALCRELELKLQLQEKITDHYRTQTIRNSYTPPPSRGDKFLRAFHCFLYFLVPLLILILIVKRR